jgi:hypothetical protein
MLIHESYESHEKHLPSEGKFIIAQFNEEDVILYQAFRNSIAQYAVKNQKLGGAGYDFNYSTCFKPSFLWMMYYSGWAKKEDKENILAIRISRNDFEYILQHVAEYPETIEAPDVQLTWTPYYDLRGDKTGRLSARIRLAGSMLHRFNDEMIKEIQNITPFVKEQQALMLHNQVSSIMVPVERVYTPYDLSLLSKINATTISL